MWQNLLWMKAKERGPHWLLISLIFSVSLLSAASVDARSRAKNLLDNTPVAQAQSLEKQKNYQQATDMYLLTAKMLPPKMGEQWRSKAAEMAWRAGNLEQASKIIKATDESQLSPLPLARSRVISARIARHKRDFERVIKLLDFSRTGLPQRMNREILSLLAQAQQETGNSMAHTATLIERYGNGDTGSSDRLWTQLMALKTQDLSRWIGKSNNSLEKGWVELAYIAKTSPSKEALYDALVEWQQKHPQHPAHADRLDAVRNQQKIVPGNLNRIAVLLPATGPISHLSDVIIDGIMAAKFNLAETQMDVRIYDTAMSENVYSLYQQAIGEGAELVIGPMSKPLVDQLATSPLTVPILALNYGNNPELYNPNLYQFALLPEDEARQIAERMTQDGLSQVGIVAPDTPWGERIIAAFNEHGLELGISVAAVARYGAQSRDFSAAIEKAFKPTEEGNGVGAEAIFLVAPPKQARLLKPLLKFHYLDDLPTYATSHAYSGTINRSDRDLNGLIFTEIPWLLKTDAEDTVNQQMPQLNELDELTRRYPRLFAFGYDSLQLAANLQQLVEAFEIQHEGLTGNLYIDDRNHIHRRLGLAHFVRGKPKVLALPLTSLLPEIDPFLASPLDEKPATRQ
jgi:outer membrane PBP1 activator LpoA protein